MAKTQTRTVLTSSVSRAAAAAATRSAVLDCTALDGGIVTFAITNSGTLGAQCEARVLVAHKDTSAPTAAAEGTGDTAWKQVYVIGGGLVSGTKTRGVYEFGPEIAYLYIEFEGNTTNAAVVEAHATTYVY